MRRRVWLLLLASLLVTCKAKEPVYPESCEDLGLSDDLAYTQSSPALRELADARGMGVGAAVSALPLDCDPAYGDALGHEFNMLTTENALTFGPVHPEPERYDFSAADAIIGFAEAHAMQVRGHALVWHQMNPEWIDQADFTREEWGETLRAHITAVVGYYKGRVRVWDVVNEAVGDGAHDLRKTVWLEGVGPDYIDKAFAWAHAADPDALLFYNDYGAEGLNAKSDKVYELVKGMLDRGVPVHGVGLQMHLGIEDAPDPEDVRANMQRLGDLGLQVHITEMDVRLPDDPDPELYEKQAEVYRQMMAVCVDAPSCTAFVTWGFTDRHSWILYSFPGEGEALLFDAAYQPKLAYVALQDALSPPRIPRPEDYGATCECEP
jgi:endo-1,4-beta-xylanase